ncbi:MAG: formyltransferase family protein [Bacteroidota bacterium]
MNDTRVLFLCSSKLALPCLQQLAFLNMLAAVVVPRHNDEMADNVRFLFKQSDIPIILVDRDDYVATITAAIQTYQVTMGLMVTFSFLVPKEVYQLPPQGFYNVHPGPLPGYRGADPIFQQIKNRESQAGVTIHVVDAAFDTGPVVMQEMIRLHPADTYGILTTKLAQVAARLVLVLLKMVTMGISIPQKPQDTAKARYIKRHTAQDVSIDWEKMDSAAIIALINACNPWNKGATTQLNGKIIRLLEAVIVPADGAALTLQAGTIVAFHENKMIVSTCDNNWLGITNVYVDEGFFLAGRLQEMGVIPNTVFQHII